LNYHTRDFKAIGSRTDRTPELKSWMIAVFNVSKITLLPLKTTKIPIVPARVQNFGVNPNLI